MKFLLLMLVVAGCGRHEMPKAHDLGDLDGDQIPNAYETSEFDKRVANVTPLGNIQAELRLKQGISTEVVSTIEFENTVDISSYTKDLLVKSIHSLPVDDYFSQYSFLRIKPGKAAISIDQAQVYVKLTVKGTDQRLDLSLISKKSTLLLGTFKGAYDFELSKDVIDKVQRGEVSLAISRNDISKSYLPSQEETVKARTYRVFYDDGIETKIFYVSKEFPFEEFIGSLGITQTQHIDEVDLLTTGQTHRAPLWWLRNLNSQDRVVVKEDVKNLSTHYLQTLETGKVKITRDNGVASGTLSLRKHPAARALVKIRGSRFLNTFNESTHPMTFQYLNKDPVFLVKLKCHGKRRELKGQEPAQVDEDQLRSTLQLVSDDAAVLYYELRAGQDEQGVFWELRVPEGVVKFDAYLKNLPESSSTTTGTYFSDCRGQGQPFYNTASINPESQLNFFFETYVEKI